VVTFQQQDVLAKLLDDTSDRFEIALRRYPDPLQAAASMECSGPEMERALHECGEPCGPLDWMQKLPPRAKSLMRRMGFTVY